MRMIVRATLLAGIITANLFASTIVQSQLTGLGGNLYRFDYTISGFAFQQNQELDIFFDPTLYGSLSNGVAPGDWNLLLFQPNVPPGAQGVYSPLALVNNPSLTGLFSVDFTFKGAGLPGAQAFQVNYFDVNGQHTLDSGLTSLAPEPAAVLLTVAGLLSGVLLFSFCRRPNLV